MVFGSALLLMFSVWKREARSFNRVRGAATEGRVSLGIVCCRETRPSYAHARMSK